MLSEGVQTCKTLSCNSTYWKLTTAAKTADLSQQVPRTGDGLEHGNGYCRWVPGARSLLKLDCGDVCKTVKTNWSLLYTEKGNFHFMGSMPQWSYWTITTKDFLKKQEGIEGVVEFAPRQHSSFCTEMSQTICHAAISHIVRVLQSY